MQKWQFYSITCWVRGTTRFRYRAILFLLYTADILGTVQNRNLYVHLYADDTQVYGSCRPSEVRALQDGVSACIDDVAVWMKSNGLQLNASKTEVGYINYQTSHFALAATRCNQYNKYETSASSSTEDSPWLSMSRRPLQAALLLFGRYTAFNGLSADWCYYLSSRHSYAVALGL